MQKILWVANLTMIVGLIVGTWIWLAIIRGPVSDAYVNSYFAAVATVSATQNNRASTSTPEAPPQVAMEPTGQGVNFLILMILFTGVLPIGLTSLVIGVDRERSLGRYFWSMMGCYGLLIGLITLLGGPKFYEALYFIVSFMPLLFLICLILCSVLITNVGWTIAEKFSERETPVVPSES